MHVDDQVRLSLVCEMDFEMTRLRDVLSHCVVDLLDLRPQNDLVVEASFQIQQHAPKPEPTYNPTACRQ